MNTAPRIMPHVIAAGPRRRHWARVVRFSKNPDLLIALDGFAADEELTRSLVTDVCVRLGIPKPRLKFHARRSPYTGACERPRSVWVAMLGEEELIRREMNGWGPTPINGALRLGRQTTLMTLAHELAHHAVFHLDPPGTPAHGKQWVARFDLTANIVRDHLPVTTR